MNHRLLLLPVVLSLASGCLSGPDSGEPDPSVPDPGGPDPGGLALPFTFTDVTEEMGITNHFHSGTPEKRYIMEAKGLSGAFFDYDGDGNLDLYILNGSRVGEPPDGDVRTNMLYRNNGALFRDVTAQAEVGHEGWGMGVTTADYDNDDDQDIYITNFGQNVLYRNDGDGTFTDVTAQAGVGDERYSTGCAFADYDLDGDLDLYVANYVDFDMHRWPAEKHTTVWRGVDVFRGPKGLKGAPDVLYRNDGNGAFTDVTSEAGIVDTANLYGLATVWGDFDEDGDPDLYVANDTVPNCLYRNNGDGTFSEVGDEAGVAHDPNGRSQSGMGCAVGDYDNDGHLDIFVTNFSLDYSALYRNNGGSSAGQGLTWFTYASYPAGLGSASFWPLSFGTGFMDFDNDGDKDLFVANGHVYPIVEAAGTGETYA